MYRERRDPSEPGKRDTVDFRIRRTPPNRSFLSFEETRSEQTVSPHRLLAVLVVLEGSLLDDVASKFPLQVTNDGVLIIVKRSIEGSEERDGQIGISRSLCPSIVETICDKANSGFTVVGVCEFDFTTAVGFGSCVVVSAKVAQHESDRGGKTHP